MELTIEEALQQGTTAHKQGKLQDAERLYRSILQSQPLHPDANHNLGVLAVSMNKVAEALTLFKIAVEANPKIEQFWLSYIGALIKEQQFDNAKQVLEHAKKQGVAGDKLNNIEAQLAPETHIENVNNTSPSQQQLNSLLEYYQNGLLDDAEKLALSIAETFPRHNLSWKVLAEILKKTDRTPEALVAGQKAIEIDPQDAGAYSNLGLTFQELGRSDEAEVSLMKAIALKPGFAEAHNNLANTLQELGRLDEAEASLMQAIALKPDYAQAHYNLGVMFEELGRLHDAEASYKQAINNDANMGKAYLALSHSIRKLGKIEESSDIYIKGLKLTSVETSSKSNLEVVIPKFAKKLQQQNGIPTFFDKSVILHLTKKPDSHTDFCGVFERGQLSKENRFVSFSERVKTIPESMRSGRLFDGLPFSASQGIHSLIKWKEHSLHKTSFDLVLYWMIMQNVKPGVIIELGSGDGGSAIWLADIASALGIDAHVYSYDINKPQLNHEKVTFIEHDLLEIDEQFKPPYWEMFAGRKLLIEDAHVNLKNVLNLFDNILSKDDYLIIEDSGSKQEVIGDFAGEKEPKYKLDQFYLDFFGTNITCSKNSIFKVS